MKMLLARTLSRSITHTQHSYTALTHTQHSLIQSTHSYKHSHTIAYTDDMHIHTHSFTDTVTDPPERQEGYMHANT